MRIISLGLILLVLASAGIFAETQQRVALDAEVLLGQQEDRSADNHLFLETSILLSYENRIMLNNYRTRFNSYSSRILTLRHQISNALSAREPRVDTVTSLRRQLESLVSEHDALLREFRQWVSNLPR